MRANHSARLDRPFGVPFALGLPRLMAFEIAKKSSLSANTFRFPLVHSASAAFRACFGRQQQVGRVLEIDAACFPDVAVVPAPRCLQQAAAAIAKPVARACIAKLLGLLGIAETIYAFGNCGRLVR